MASDVDLAYLEEEHHRRLDEVEQRAEDLLERKLERLRDNPEADIWVYDYAEGSAADLIAAANPNLTDIQFGAAIQLMMDSAEAEGEIDEDGEPQARLVFTIDVDEAIRSVLPTVRPSTLVVRPRCIRRAAPRARATRGRRVGGRVQARAPGEPRESEPPLVGRRP